MPITSLALALSCTAFSAPLQITQFAQSSLDPPAAAHAYSFGSKLAVDGDRAVISGVESTGALLKVFREFELQGGAWVQIDELTGFVAKAVDMEAGTAVGPDGIAERGAGGWTHALATYLQHTSFDIEGEVAVAGFGIGATCSFAYWDGRIAVYERSAPVGSSAPGSWAMTADLREDDCFVESRLGEHVAIDGGQIIASRDHGYAYGRGSFRTYERDASGQWTPAQEFGADPLDRRAGYGLVAEDGVLVTSGRIENCPPLSCPSPPRNQLRVYTRDAAGLWSYSHGLDVQDWGLESASFEHRIQLGLFAVAAPAPTGIGARIGAIVGEQQRNSSHFAIGTFDPSVSVEACSGVPNSTGAPATLTVFGSDRLIDDRMQFHVTNVPPGTLVLPLVSTSFGVIPNPGGSAGNLCVGAGAIRLVALAGAASSSNEYRVNLDLAALPQSPLQPGDRLFLQAWYRDAPTTNLSSAVAVQVF